MTDIKLAVEDDGLIRAYQQVCLHAEDFVNVSTNRTVNRVGDDVLESFQQEPGAVVYSRGGKLDWKSDRQRRAFYASKGFGRGIPYIRRSAPNRMVDHWKLIVVYQPGQITSIILRNDDPAHKFVTGQFQQPFHAITGWWNEQDLANKAGKRLVDEIETDLIKAWYAIDAQGVGL